MLRGSRASLDDSGPRYQLQEGRSRGRTASIEFIAVWPVMLYADLGHPRDSYTVSRRINAASRAHLLSCVLANPIFNLSSRSFPDCLSLFIHLLLTKTVNYLRWLHCQDPNKPHAKLSRRSFASLHQPRRQLACVPFYAYVTAAQIK